MPKNRIPSRLRLSLSIRQKLMATLATCLIVGTAITGFTAYQFGQGVLVEHLYDRLNLVAHQRRHALLETVRKKQESILSVSARPRLRQLLIDLSAARIDTASFRSGAQALLDEALESHTPFRRLGLLDLQGRVLVATDSHFLSLDFRADTDFRAGLTASHLGMPRPSKEGDLAHLTAPVLSQEGTPLGVLLAFVDVNPLKSVMDDTTGLARTGEVLIGQREGADLRYYLHRGEDGRTTTEPVPADSALLLAVSGEPSFVVAPDYRGRDIVAKALPLGYEGWGLVVKMDREEAHAPLRVLRYALLASVLCILVFGLAGVQLFTRRFTRPILSLAGLAHRVARGDLAGRAEVPGSDELSALARAFNHMLAELEGSRRLLEERNRALESEMQERQKAQEELLRSEDQLRQSHKMEAVGRLAGGIAHDFNNLLTAITGYSDLLLSQVERGHPMHQGLHEISKAADRAAALTRQLLAYSRKQVLAPRILDLNEVIRDMHEMLRRLIGEDVRISLNLDPAIRALRADRGQLEQVVMNLSLNARDAMPRGGLLCISTRSRRLSGGSRGMEGVELPSGDYVELTLSDTGSGMNDEVKAHLFEPFFTTKGVGKGTGLGLPTVYGIVRQSGGSVAVESELGVGTLFRILLPACLEGPSAKAPLPPPPALPARRGTVLVAEDEESVRALMRDVLTRNGYQVLLAPDGQQALEIDQRHVDAIDLLVTDVVMAGMGGRQLAENLRSRRPGLKVLYISGYTDDAMLRHGVSQASMDFLQKPFSATSLQRKVADLLHSAVALR